MSELSDALFRRSMRTRLVGSEEVEKDMSLIIKAAENYEKIVDEWQTVLDKISEYKAALLHCENIDDLAEVINELAARLLDNKPTLKEDS